MYGMVAHTASISPSSIIYSKLEKWLNLLVYNLSHYIIFH